MIKAIRVTLERLVLKVSKESKGFKVSKALKEILVNKDQRVMLLPMLTLLRNSLPP